jgi:hypothetical protein
MKQKEKAAPPDSGVVAFQCRPASETIGARLQMLRLA